MVFALLFFLVFKDFLLVAFTITTLTAYDSPTKDTKECNALAKQFMGNEVNKKAYELFKKKGCELPSKEEFEDNVPQWWHTLNDHRER